LARDLGIPPTTLQERIRRLERQGVIRGYGARVDPSKLGFLVQAMVAVSLDRHESNDIRQFETAVQTLSRVKSCYHVSGRFDYLLHVVVKDLEALGEFVKTRVTALPDFGRCETFLIFSEIETSPNGFVEADLGSSMDTGADPSGLGKKMERREKNHADLSS
jgi:Lrp/AsnC family leucine-responsive transcriptional regulator